MENKINSNQTIWVGTQEEFNALNSYSSDILYFITKGEDTNE